MAIGSTVNFTKAATNININGPAEPQQVSEFPQYTTDQTIDGTRFVYRHHSATISIWTLALVDLTTAQKTSLRDFYITDVSGPTLTFIYTHTDGISYTARFIDPAVPLFTRNNNNNWNVTIRLELTAEVDS